MGRQAVVGVCVGAGGGRKGVGWGGCGVREGCLTLGIGCMAPGTSGEPSGRNCENSESRSVWLLKSVDTCS